MVDKCEKEHYSTDIQKLNHGKMPKLILQVGHDLVSPATKSQKQMFYTEKGLILLSFSC